MSTLNVTTSAEAGALFFKSPAFVINGTRIRTCALIIIPPRGSYPGFIQVSLILIKANHHLGPSFTLVDQNPDHESQSDIKIIIMKRGNLTPTSRR